MQLSEEKLVERALDELAGNPIGTRNIVETTVRLVLRAQAEARPVWQIQTTPDSWIDVDEGTWKWSDESRRRIVYTHPAPEAAQAGLSDEGIKFVEAVRDTFQRDLSQGYVTKDKQYAVSMLNKALEFLARDPATPQGEQTGEVERWKHVANEWADVATSALCWLRNISEGISEVQKAIENTEEGIAHCRDVQAQANGAQSTQPAEPSGDERAAWFAALMEAGAALENASYSIGDADAERAALGAAKHVRERANALWAAQSGQRARGTPEQILTERKLTCEAIEGAIAFGYQNVNPPPSDEHWLAPFWKIGRKQAELEQSGQRAGVAELREIAENITANAVNQPNTDWGKGYRQACADIAGGLRLRANAAAPAPAAQTQAEGGQQ